MKTVCVYHSRDLDGWMSAAIVKKWFIENNKNCEINGLLGKGWESYNYDKKDLNDIKESDVNRLKLLGYDYGDDIPDLDEYDKVIMVDVSFPKEEMGKLLTKLNGKLTWIDHHISAINDNKELMSIDTLYGLRDTSYAACELAWQYFFPNATIPEIVRLLGRYDCFGHKGTDEEQKVLEFQYGARQVISNYEEAYDTLSHSLTSGDYSATNIVNTIHDNGIAIYNYLCSDAKQTYNKAFPIILKEPTSRISAEVADGTGFYVNRKFLCVNQERFNPINFGIDYHKDKYSGFACFWYKDSKWNFSLYNDNGEVDCSLIAKQYNGGGHKGAAGFVINDIEEFLNKHKIK